MCENTSELRAMSLTITESIVFNSGQLTAFWTVADKVTFTEYPTEQTVSISKPGHVNMTSHYYINLDCFLKTTLL